MADLHTVSRSRRWVTQREVKSILMPGEVISMDLRDSRSPDIECLMQVCQSPMSDNFVWVLCRKSGLRQNP